MAILLVTHIYAVSKIVQNETLHIITGIFSSGFTTHIAITS